MKRSIIIVLILVLLLTILALPATAAVNDTVWRKFFDAGEEDGIYASATDRNGNLIIAGEDGDFAFVSKYRPGGAHVWTKKFGAVGAYMIVADLAINRDGFIYVAGTTDGGDSDSYSEVGFIRKYGPKGGHHWTKKFGPGWSFTNVAGVAVGPAGSIYVTGSTDGDFKGRSEDWGLTSTYLRKYNPAGKVYWTRQFYVPVSERGDYENETYAVDVAVGPGGGVYVLAVETDWGYYEEDKRLVFASRARGTIRQQKQAVKLNGYFDPEMDDEYWEGEESSVVLKKFSPRGGVYWTRGFGKKRGLMSTGLAVDRTGSPVIAGDTRKGSFATKFSHKGRRQWTRFWSGLDAWDVEVDRAGNIYLVGVEGMLQSSWGAGGAVYPEAYTRKLSPSGEKQWTRTFLNGIAFGASTDLAGNLYVFGHALTKEKDFLVKFKN